MTAVIISKTTDNKYTSGYIKLVKELFEFPRVGFELLINNFTYVMGYNVDPLPQLNETKTYQMSYFNGRPGIIITSYLSVTKKENGYTMVDIVFYNPPIKFF